MTNLPEDRPPMVVAYQWAVRITTVCFEMVLPGLAGYWVDQRLGTKILLTLLGFAGGMMLGIWHLIRMTNADNQTHPPPTEGAPDR